MMVDKAMDLVEGLAQDDYSVTLDKVAGRADLIFMSPPYGNVRNYGAEVSWEFSDYQLLGDAVAGALRPDGGQCLMVLAGTVADYRGDSYTERSLIPYRVLIDWRDRLGLVAPDLLFYRRDGFTGRYERGFRNEIDPMLWFATPGCRTFHKERIPVRRRSADDGPRRYASNPQPEGQRWNPRERKLKQGPTDLPVGFKMPGNVWDYGAVGMNKSGCKELEDEHHPASFPFRLARDVVQCFSEPGHLVVDPFFGVGTTMIAALDGKRRFAGGDLHSRAEDGKSWVDVARHVAENRYSQEMIDDPVIRAQSTVAVA